MLKVIDQFIRKRYRIDSNENRQKFVGLLFIAVIGLLFAMFLLGRHLSGRNSEEFIPGDISLFMFFGLFFFSTYTGKVKWAIHMIYLLPFVVYFYFISIPYSAYPVPDSVHYTLWTLVTGFPFLLLFDNQIKKIAIYFVVTEATLVFHLSEAGKLNLALGLQWPVVEPTPNPLFVLLIVSFIFSILSLYYQRIIDDFKKTALENIEQFNKAFKSLTQGMMILEINYDEYDNPVSISVKRVNPAFESIFKMPLRELRGKEASTIFPRLFRGAFDWNDVFMISKKPKFEFYAEHLDRWFEGYTLRPGGNQIVCIFYDVSSRQRSIDQLKESRQRFKVLLEAIPDIFFIIDKDGIYADFVIKESENIKIDPNDIVGNSIFEVGFSEKMARKIYQCIQDCIGFDSIETIEYALEVEKGTVMFEMRIAKLNDESVIAIARDITKRKIAEIKIEEAKAKAEESDRLKSAFLATISHEIRTPMNAIIGFSKMVSSPDFSLDEKNKFLDIIISNGRMLMALINDMISLSKIESNQVEILKSNCLINDLLVVMYKELLFDLDEPKKVTIKMKNENSNPKFSIYTDQNLLKEILEKLLDNALKFTEKGSIEFGYTILKDSKIEFFVKDTGIGIGKEDIERIFERFHQLDNRTTRNYEGAGLGLSIAQHYVSLLGGTMSVKSEPGVGSTFSFILPMDNPKGHLKIVR